MDYKNNIQDNLFTHIQIFKLPPLLASEPEVTMRVRDIDFVISEKNLKLLTRRPFQSFSSLLLLLLRPMTLNYLMMICLKFVQIVIYNKQVMSTTLLIG
jgi:hypothetical protein